MVLKSHNPTTPSRRSLIIVDRAGLWNGAPVKSLTEGKTKNGGRNNKGRITARRIGGGHKKKYRIIDSNLDIDFNKKIIIEKINNLIK